MKHITETQLNEYLDNTLDKRLSQEVETHLSICGDCCRALDELRNLAAVLITLPDEPLCRDLTPSVLAKLPQPRTRLVWKLLLAAQAGIAIGMVILLLSNLLAWFQPQEWLALVFSQLASLELPLSYPQINIPQLPAFNFQTSSTNIVFLAVSALLLWGVGNAILLRNRHEASS
jgi:hypothetical protein